MPTLSYYSPARQNLPPQRQIRAGYLFAFTILAFFLFGVFLAIPSLLISRDYFVIQFGNQPYAVYLVLTAGYWMAAVGAACAGILLMGYTVTTACRYPLSRLIRPSIVCFASLTLVHTAMGLIGAHWAKTALGHFRISFDIDAIHTSHPVPYAFVSMGRYYTYGALLFAVPIFLFVMNRGWHNYLRKWLADHPAQPI